MSTLEKSGRPTAEKDSLARRAASAAVLIPIAIAALYAGGAVFAAIVAFASTLMIFEWTRMIDGRDFSASFYALALAGAGAFAFAAAGQFVWAYALCGVGALASGLAAAIARRRWRWAAFGAAYVLAPSVALIWLRSDTENGRSLVLMLFLIVWGADTGGYMGGRLVGGPKMSPVVSPAKTWAGAAGGVIMGALAGLVTALFIFQRSETAFLVVVGASLGLASILGDTAESAFKRIFGVKDASGFIPGHGGVLDRLDGMIFATTAMSLVLYFHSLVGRFEG
ncbi:MAG: phosphatidate cytidylyltransferase [Alphaproteobacteria bacterium]|nr:phosphatidate cytidylyltransferase [Alphaproteobacteria bacterium]